MNFFPTQGWLHMSAGQLPVSPRVFASLIVAQIAFVVLAFSLFHPVVPLGLALTALFAILIMADIRMSVVAIAFTTFFMHSETIGEVFIVKLAGINFYAMDWILIFSGCSMLFRRASDPRGFRISGKLDLPLGIFLLVLPVFVGVGLANGYPLQHAAADARWFFYYVSYYLVVAVVTGEKTLSLLFWSVFLMGIAGTIPEIVGSFTNPEVDSQTGRMLAFGRIRGANEVNYPMLLAAAVIAYRYMDSLPKRLVIGFGGAVSATALFLSYTRGSWLAAAFGIVAPMLFYRGTGIRRIRILFGGALLGACILGIMNLLGIFTLDVFIERMELTSFTRIDLSALQRVTEWLVALELFLKHPLFGAGLGYTYSFYAFGVGDLRQVFIHNSYFYVLSKMGLVGMSFFLFLYARVLIVSRRTAAAMQEGPAAGYYLAFCAMLFVLLFKAITTWHLNNLTTSLFVGTIFGVLGGRLKTGASAP